MREACSVYYSAEIAVDHITDHLPFRSTRKQWTGERRRVRFSERKGAEKVIFSGNCPYRFVWECRGGIRDRVRRNAAKPCSACVCWFFSGRRNRHKSGFDHRNDHRQKNLYFYPSPWYHGRKVNIRVWLNW